MGEGGRERGREGGREGGGREEGGSNGSSCTFFHFPKQKKLYSLFVLQYSILWRVVHSHCDSLCWENSQLCIVFFRLSPCPAHRKQKGGV